MEETICYQKIKLNELMNYQKNRKQQDLSIEEAKEQTQLRKEYLETFRSSMRDTIEHVKVIDPEGNDVTPDKVKQARNSKYSKLSLCIHLRELSKLGDVE